MVRTHRPRQPAGSCLLSAALGFMIIVFLVLAAATAVTTQALTPEPQIAVTGFQNLSLVQLANTLSAQLALQLEHGPDAVAVVNAADLTALARSVNPDPATFLDLRVGTGRGTVIVQARVNLAGHPTTVTVTSTISLATSPVPVLSVRILTVRLGRLDIPESAIATAGIASTSTLGLEALLRANGELQLLRTSLDCLAVTPAGLVVGFHTPSSPPVPDLCARGAA